MGVLLLFVCITGTLATVSHEIEYLIDQKYRAITLRDKTNWPQLEIELANHFPNSYIQSVNILHERYLAGEVRLITGNQFSFVYFDPNTGQILGSGKWGRVSRFLRDIHMNFSMGWIGKSIVTSLSMLLLITLVTSFYVYRRWWRYFFKQPKMPAKTKRSTWSGWHKFLGLWSWWFLAVMTVTSLWYLVEQVLITAKIERYPSSPHIQTVSDGKPLPMTRLLDIGQRAFPSLDISQIRYPSSANSPVVIWGYNNDILVRDRANRIYLDPVTGHVIDVQRASDLPVLARIVDTADPLHFGNFSNLTVKLIWFVFGILMTIIIALSIWMSWLRTKKKRPSVIKWQGLSGAIALVLCLAALIITTAKFSKTTQGNSLPFSPKLLEVIGMNLE